MMENSTIASDQEFDEDNDLEMLSRWNDALLPFYVECGEDN